MKCAAVACGREHAVFYGLVSPYHHDMRAVLVPLCTLCAALAKESGERLVAHGYVVWPALDTTTEDDDG